MVTTSLGLWGTLWKEGEGSTDKAFSARDTGLAETGTAYPGDLERPGNNRDEYQDRDMRWSGKPRYVEFEYRDSKGRRKKKRRGEAHPLTDDGKKVVALPRRLAPEDDPSYKAPSQDAIDSERVALLEDARERARLKAAAERAERERLFQEARDRANDEDDVIVLLLGQV